MISLESINSHDFELWEAMRAEIYPSLDKTFHEKEMSQTLSNPDWNCFFIVENKKETIGLIELSSRNIVDGCLSSPVVYLEGLFLKPEYRGNGLGTQVMNMIFAWSRNQGFSELATDAELSNTRAQHFYQTMGFSEVDRVVEYRLKL